MTLATTTGVEGLDDILGGGYPAEKVTILKGQPGCGKTLFGLFFAIGQLQLERPVVLVTCDESPQSLVESMQAFGFKANTFIKSKRLVILDMRPNFSTLQSGEYELSSVLLRIRHAMQDIGSSFLVIDSLQNLLIGLSGVRPEHNIYEVFEWCREAKITSLVTMGGNAELIKSNYMEEYVSDCLIRLVQEVDRHLMTRYIRVMKRRGRSHGTNEYSYGISRKGISLLPITSSLADSRVSGKRIRTGIKKLDEMLGGKGYFEGTSVLLSGRSGSGKTLLAAQMAAGALQQGKRILYFSFEEHPKKIERNVRSIGLDFTAHSKSRDFLFASARSVEKGIEDHLHELIELVREHKTELLIIDPITALEEVSSAPQVKTLMIRFMAAIQQLGVTTIYTELIADNAHNVSGLNISSIIDTWIKVDLLEVSGESIRTLKIIKSRGMATNNKTCELVFSGDGMVIQEPYTVEGKYFFGDARRVHIQADMEELEYKQQQLRELRKALELVSDTRVKQTDKIESEERETSPVVLEKTADLISKINLVSKQIRKLKGHLRDFSER